MCSVRTHRRVIHRHKCECMWRALTVGGQRGNDTSELVSTRKRVCIVVSLTKNRRLGRGPLAPVAASVRLGSFPNCMAPCISKRLHHIFTCRQNRWSHAVVQRGCDDMRGSNLLYSRGRDRVVRDATSSARHVTSFRSCFTFKASCWLCVMAAISGMATAMTLLAMSARCCRSIDASAEARIILTLDGSRCHPDVGWESLLECVVHVVLRWV